MPARRLIPAALLLAVLAALPACNKSKETKPDDGGGGGGGDGDGSSLSYGPGDTAAAKASKNKLRQIVTAAHNFHDTYNFIPAGVADRTGKAGLSWRVALLPYLGQGTLHKQFKLDEPWDSEHNKKLVTSMPDVFAAPGGGIPGETYYQVFTGQGAPFGRQFGPPTRPGEAIRGPQLMGFVDGTANTLLVAEGTESVPWTKPADIAYAPGKPVKVGGGLFSHGFHGAMADGSVHFFSKNLDPKTLDLLIQIGDGMPIPQDAFGGR